MKQEFYENTIRFPAEMKADMHKTAQSQDRSLNWITVHLWQKEIERQKRKRKRTEKVSES